MTIGNSISCQEKLTDVTPTDAQYENDSYSGRIEFDL